jgi:SAM-dependent methyltransferase
LVWYTCSANTESLGRDARARSNRLGLSENHARYQEGVMDESNNFDLDQMMERIRSNVHGQRQQVEAVSAPPSERPQGDYHEQQRDLGTLHTNYDVSDSPLKLERKVLGRLMKRAVDFVNELLWPRLRRQSEYNAANARLTDFLKRQADWLVPDYVEFRDRTERMLGDDRAQFKAQLEGVYRRFAKLYADDISMRGRALDELTQRVAAGERLDREYQGHLQQLQAIERGWTELRQELDSYSAAIHDLTQRVETLARRYQLLDQQAGRLEALDTRQAQLAQGVEATRLAQEKIECELRNRGEEFQAMREAQAHGESEARVRLEEFQAMGQAQAQIESEVRGRNDDFQAMRVRLLRVERRLRRIGMVENGSEAMALPELSVPPPALAEIDYAGFEDILRTSETIKNKQRGYLTYFSGKAPVIDVGCGRGEFLELMREAGVEARGLDLDLDMTLLCKEKGLDVVHCDALAYLADAADDSLGGIFSAQVIEHLTSAQLNALIALAARKLKPGGSLVLETLNPESLFVHYKWFWMDPSHVRLVHPYTLKFLLESAGFAEVSYSLSSPPFGVLPIPQLQGSGVGPLDVFNRATDYLNKLIYGDQEYFVFGRK